MKKLFATNHINLSKCAIALLILLSFAGGAWGSPTYVGGNKGSGGTPLTVNYTSTAGNLLVIGVYSGSGTATFAISDSATQSWTAGTINQQTSRATQMFYMPNSAAVTWVKVTVTNSGGTPRLIVAEFSGCATSSVLEAEKLNQGTGTSLSTGNFTVTTGDLVVGFAVDLNAGVADPGSGYSMPSELHDTVAGMEYQTAAGTTVNAVWTAGNGGWNAAGMGFYPAASSSVADPTVDNGTWTYPSTVTVALSDATSGAAICYTTNGSTPGAATAGTCDGAPTQTYSTGLTFTSTTTLKAIGTKSGSTNSGVLTQVYTIRAPQTFYVNPDATGAANGSSWADAFTTPNAVFAATALGSGDVIELDGGASGKTYSTGTTAIINVGTSNQKSFTIRGSSVSGHNGTVIIETTVNNKPALLVPVAVAANTVTIENLTLKQYQQGICASLRGSTTFNNVTFDGSGATNDNYPPIDISGPYTFTINRSLLKDSHASRFMMIAGNATVNMSNSIIRNQVWSYPATTETSAVGVYDSVDDGRSTFNSYNNVYGNLVAGALTARNGYSDIVSKNDIFIGTNNYQYSAGQYAPFYAKDAGDTITVYNSIIMGPGRLPKTLTYGSGTITLDASCKQYVDPKFAHNQYTGLMAITIDSSDKTYCDTIKALGDTAALPLSFAVYKYSVVENPGTRWAATEAEVKTLLLAYQTAGHELVNHSISHPHLLDTEAFKATYSGAGENPRITVSGTYPNLSLSALTDSGTDVGPLDLVSTSYDLIEEVRVAIDAHADWAAARATNFSYGTRSKGLKAATTAVSTGTSIPFDIDTNYHHWKAEIVDMAAWLDSFLGAGKTKGFIIPYATRASTIDYSDAWRTWMAANYADTKAYGARTMDVAEYTADPAVTMMYSNLYGAGNLTKRMGTGTVRTQDIVSGGTGSTSEATIRANTRAIIAYARETGNPTIITVHETECSATEFGYIINEIKLASGISVMKFGDLMEYLASAGALADAGDYRLHSGSPAIDTGTPILTYAEWIAAGGDYAGKNPTNGTFSIGAYQYQKKQASFMPGYTGVFKKLKTSKSTDAGSYVQP